MVDKSTMTVKQKRFCEEYLISGNATQAAVAAGYSQRTARAIGTENLQKPYIRDYIQSRLHEMDEKSIAKADEVMEYLTAAMRGQVQEEFPMFNDDGVSIGKKQISPRDRNKAAELLAKRFGLLTDKLNVSGNVGVEIIDDVPDESDDEDEPNKTE